VSASDAEANVCCRLPARRHSGCSFAGQRSARAQPAEPKPAPVEAALPDAEQIVVLLRTTILTLNDALWTGNFTVLRDVSAPGFREANSAAKLGVIFGDLMKRRVDLSAAATLVLQLSAAPGVDPRTGLLRIKGFFPGQQQRIDFEMLFQPVGGRWRVFGMSVQPGAAEQQTTSNLPQAAPAAAKPPSGKPETPASSGKPKPVNR
jgi:hypothetical protein